MPSVAEDLVKQLIAAADASRLDATEMGNLKQEYLSQVKEMKKYNESLIKNLSKQKEYRKALRDTYDQLIKKIKLDKQQTKELDNLNKKLARDTEGVKQFAKAFDKVIPAFKNVMSQAGRLAGSIGAISFTFDSLVETSYKYSKAVFSISRMQRVAGDSAGGLSNALKYVSTNTAMAQMEFLELASTMQDTFIGIKPSAMDMAKVIGTIGEQFGYDYKQAQKLSEMQSRMPQLYDKVARGLELIEKIKAGGKDVEQHKATLDAIKAESLAMVQAGELGSQAYNYVIQSLTSLSDAEREQSEILRQRAVLTKEISDLQVELSKELQPLIKQGLDLAKTMVKAFSDYKEVIITIGTIAAGLRGLIGLAGAFKTAGLALMGPWGLVAAAVMAISGAIALYVAKQRQAKEAAETHRKEIEKQAAIQKDLAGYSIDQKRKYDEVAKKRKEMGKAIRDELEEHIAIDKEVKAEVKTSDKLYLNYDKVRIQADMQLKILGNINEALKTAVATEEEFGGRAEEASRSLVRVAEMQAKAAGSKFRASLEAAMASLKESKIDVKIDAGADFSKQYEQLNAALLVVQETNMEEDKQQKIVNALSQAMKEGVEWRQKDSDITRNINSLMEINIRQQEKFTSAYEARLDTERKLMESAQFGLGASVEMMKQQVELAYKMMQTYAESDKHWASELQRMYEVSDLDMKRIQNAKTQAEAEDYIRKTMGRSGKEAQALNSYAVKHQEITKKIMDQQQKIYDLTKDIREGYLDAIREMAVGAGEFEKIIGTQEMGVTQLMKAVKDVTGVAKLNTMALGGLQEQVLTTQGVGTQVTGRYGAGGIEFIGTQQQEARNTRIYRYGEARAQTEAIIRGQVAGKKSAMGTGAVPGVEKYVGPGREGNIEEQTYDGSYQGTYNAMVDVFSGRGKGAMAQKKWAITTGREFSKSVMGVNTGVAGGAGVPGAEISSRIEARPENINPATYRYMGGRPAPAPAKNVDVYGVPGRKLPPPTGFVARTVKNWGVSANKTKDIQTAYKEGGEKGALLAAEMAKIEESRFGPKGVGALKNILHSTKRNFVMQENRILKEKRKIYSEFENLASKFEKSRVEQEYQTMFSRGRRKFGYGTLVKKWLDRKFGIDLEESKEPSLVGRKQTYKETREKLLKLRQQEGELRQDLEKSEKEYKKAEEWSKISTKPHKEFFRAQDEKIKAEEAMAKRDREDAEEYDLIQGYYKGIGYKDRDTARRAKDKERVREERREFSYLLKESERALEKYDKEERERVMGVRTPANKVYALDRKESDSKINKIMAKEIEDAQAQAQAGMAVIDVRKTKGYTSAAEERGEIASPAVQREYMANRGAIQTVFGSAEDTGLGSAVITVNLAPGLMARVDEAHGVSVDVRQAANQTV